MNRGSEPGRNSPHTWSSGFNEAPIHESGKWEQERRETRERKGFNEAPIHESGKSHHKVTL